MSNLATLEIEIPLEDGRLARLTAGLSAEGLRDALNLIFDQQEAQSEDFLLLLDHARPELEEAA
jgi:hypothetical protein